MLESVHSRVQLFISRLWSSNGPESRLFPPSPRKRKKAVNMEYRLEEIEVSSHFYDYGPESLEKLHDEIKEPTRQGLKHWEGEKGGLSSLETH